MTLANKRLTVKASLSPRSLNRGQAGRLEGRWWTGGWVLYVSAGGQVDADNDLRQVALLDSENGADGQV